MGSNRKTEVGPEPERGPTGEMIGIWVTLWLVAWFGVILVTFFFVGVIAGVVAIIGGAVISMLAFARAIRRTQNP
jgi:hypothetical protein